MGAVKFFRNNALPAPGSRAADEIRFVKIGSSYIQYVIDNSGNEITPAVMAHSHDISDVANLQTALDGKSATNHVHANATTSVSGFMSAADKAKLDALSNYSHPDSGVSAGTYRSVTVNAQGHVTGGTNPTTLSEYGITQRFVALDPTNGFATPTLASQDLNTVAYTSYGYATTATNRPTGAAANGYFTTNAVDSSSFFQTFANPGVQDAFFYRRKNTSTLYAWLQVASREWVTQNYVAGSGTANYYAIFSSGSTLTTSILSQNSGRVFVDGDIIMGGASGMKVMMAGNVGASYLFFTNNNTSSPSAYGWISGESTKLSFANGSGVEAFRVNYSGADVTFAKAITIGGSAAVLNVTSTTMNPNLNADMVDGLHASSFALASSLSGYVPTSRTITINGTSYDLSANRSWTVSGSGTWNDSLAAGNVATALPIITRSNATTSNDYIQFKPSDYGVGKPYLALSKGFTANKWEFYSYDGVSTTGTVNFAVTLTQYDVPVLTTARTLSINGTTFDLSANRSWTIATGVGGSGTTGRIPIFSASSTLADSLLSVSGINVIANQGQFVSDIAPASGPRGIALQNGTVRWVIGKFYNETGSNAGSDLVYHRYSDTGASLGDAMIISRATGNVTFYGTMTVSGGNSTNWNSAYSWGNHASAGYVPNSRTITINGTTFDLSANRSWSISTATTNLDGLSDVTISSPFTGDILVYSSGIWSNTQPSFASMIDVNNAKADVQAWVSSNFVPNYRTITINGTTYDLSANRSWSISSGGISGSGSSNYIPMWNGSTSLTNSLLEYVGGILTRVNGNLYISNFLIPRQCTQSERLAMGYSQGGMVYQTDGSEGLYIYKSSGWVQIV